MRRPELEKNQEIEFVRGADSADVRARRYKGKVKQVLGDAVQINVTDEKWTGARETVVRFKDVIDPATGERFSLKRADRPAPPAQEEAITLPQPAPLPQLDASSSGEHSFRKSDLDAWLSMGRDMLNSVDSMIEEKRGEILIIEEDMKALADQRNTALEEIKELETRKAMLAEFYKDRR
jgi:hypothetical protein